MNYFQTKKMTLEEKGDVLVISGYASTGDVDRGGDQVLPEAFTETVRDRASKSPIPMLLQHDGQKVLGDWPEMEIDAKGLAVVWNVKYDIDECKIKIKNKDLNGLSIGYRVEEWEVRNAQGTVVYNSNSGLCPGYDVDDMWKEDSVRVIKKVELVEISVVSIPMNPFAFINSVKKFFAIEQKNLMWSITEKKEWEAEPLETPDETNHQETDVEIPAGETPVPLEETPEETPAPDKSEVVKADEEPEVVPEVVPEVTPEVIPEEVPEETPKGMTETEVKDLIASAVAEAVKWLTEEIASLKKSLGDDTLAKSYETLSKDHDTLKKKFEDLDKSLSQEVFPERKSFTPSNRRVGITDSMVLGTLGQ